MGFSYIIGENHVQIVNNMNSIALSHEKFREIQHALNEFKQKESLDPPGFEFGG